MSVGLDSLVAQAVPDRLGPGCLIATVGPDEVETAFRGMANVEHQVPIGPETVFHLASVSKQFTAYAVALLAEDGALTYEDSVARHLPWLHFDEITVEQLIRHASGLRDQWQLVEAAGRRMEDVITNDDIVRLLAAQRGLNFPAGSRFAYSNSNYTLLALLVEALSGSTLQEFCQRRIFGPLGMTHTRFLADLHQIIPRRADSYDSNADGGFRRIALSYSTVGASSLNSTAGDLVRWVRHVATDEARARREGMVPLPFGGRASYRLGVKVASYDGATAVSHGGADAGYRCHVVTLPDQGVSAVVLANLASVPVGPLSYRALDLARGVVLRPTRPQWVPDPDVLGSLAGSYRDDRDGARIRLAVHGNVLGLTTAFDSAQLEPTAPRCFGSMSADGYVVDLTGAALLLYDDEFNGPLTLSPCDEPKFEDIDHEALAGLYFSTEVDAHLRLSCNGDSLVLARPQRAPFTLTPVEGRLFAGEVPDTDEVASVTVLVAPDRMTLLVSTSQAREIPFVRHAARDSGEQGRRGSSAPTTNRRSLWHR